MKQALWIAVLGAAMVAGCGKDQGSVATRQAADSTGNRHFTNTTALAQRRLARLDTPLYFEPNVGQAGAQAQFLARGPGFQLFLTSTGAMFKLTGATSCTNAPCASKSVRTPDMVRMAFAGANPKPAIEGFEPQRAKSHYFIGKDPAGWHRNVRRYAKVRYRGVYPGVDVVFYGNEQALEYDFVVAPHADTDAIAFDLGGVRDVRVDGAGNLVMRTPHGELQQHKPTVYQQVNGKRVPVDGRYALLGKGRVGFALGKHDPSSPVVIDPMFGFSTYAGMLDMDEANAVATDATGNTYVAGSGRSVDSGQYDQAAYVTKLDVDGNVLYTTYLGGTYYESGDSIAVDALGRVYIAGRTDSEDFPVVNAAQDHLGGMCDAFVARLSADGSALDYATYFGGSGCESFDGVEDLESDVARVLLAIDAGGSAYIAGGTDSSDLPVVNALQPQLKTDAMGSYTDGFLAKLSPDGGTVVYATYLGGSYWDTVHGIAVDANGNAYVAGSTRSIDFPTVSAVQGAPGGFNDFGDAFVAEVSADGSTLVYSTYLGGVDVDRATAIAVDADGNAYVTGITDGASFPFSQSPSACPSDEYDYSIRGFVAEIAAQGQALAYSTCLKSTHPSAIALDAVGNLYVTGEADADLPVVNPMQAQLNGGSYQTDAFVSELAVGGGSLLFSTYLGGDGNDAGTGIAVDGTGIIHVTGKTSATDFPTTNGSSAVNKGFSDGFIATIQDGIELTVADFKVLEGDDVHQVTFNVHLSSAATEPVTFDLDTVDFGSESWAATEGSDYEGVHARGLVMAPGETDKAITLTIDGDTTPESGAPAYLAYPGESFLVMPSNVVGAVLRDPSATVTIGNDDAVLSMHDVSVMEGGAGEQKYDAVTVGLSARVVQPVSFLYMVTEGSATPNSDYVADWQGYAELGGQQTVTLPITILGDDTLEPDETFQVAITSVDGATLGQGTGTITIANDDAIPLSIADASVVEGDSGTKLATFTVSLAQPTTTPVTFDVATQNGTAAAGSDYTATSLTGVTIPAGSTSTTVPVPVTGDTAIEANETFKVLVSNVAGAAVTDGTAIGTIRNDDTKLSIADVSVIEGNAGSKLATFTIKLSNASANAVTFNVATANKTAAAGSDYVAKSLTGQSIAAGATSKTFTVSILGDRTVEANETMLVNVSHVAGAVVSDSQAIGTIRNDDAILSIGDVSTTEGSSGTKLMTFTVKLSAVSAAPVSFNFATANKTALAGSDYVARSLTGQVIAAGATSKAFTVTLNGDRTREANETFLVNIGSVAGATVGDGQAVGTIVNDD